MDGFQDKMVLFFKRNIIIIMAMVVFAVIEKMVPLASGDDWTFCTWYKGISEAPKVMTWLWNNFNGRPTLYYTFSCFDYYFGIWFLVTPIAFFLYYISIKKLFSIQSAISQLFVLAALMYFSWEICRNIYLWPTGNSAYVFPWAIILFLFAYTVSYEQAGFHIISTMIGVFLIGLGNENASLATFFMFCSYFILEWRIKGKGNIRLCMITVISALSAALCILNPSGKRYESAMSQVSVPLDTMIHDNFNRIILYLLNENGILFLPLSCIIIYMVIVKRDRPSIRNILYLSYTGIFTVILSIDIIIKYLEINSIGFQKVIFANNIIVDALWYIYIILLLSSIFLIEISEELRVRWISLFVFSIISCGVFFVLPEISQRSMFYSLCVIVFYTAFILNENYIIPKNFNRGILICLLFAIVIRFDRFMYILIPAQKVTEERQEIVEEYHRLVGLGKDKDIDIIYFPKYNANSINWDDTNINPKPGINDYAYNAMKEYYGIPDEVEVVLHD